MKSLNLRNYQPILVKLSLLVLLLPLLHGNVTGQQPETVSIEVSALIDGVDQLHIQGNRIWYEHMLWQLPGYFDGAQEPTMLNDYEWYAQFDQPEDVQQASQVLEGVIEIPYYSIDYELRDISVMGYTNEDPGVARSIDQIVVLQQPNEDNGYELVIGLDDNEPAGAAWMQFTIYVEYVVEYANDPVDNEQVSTKPTIALVGPNFLSMLMQTYIGLTLMVMISKYISSRD